MTQSQRKNQASSSRVSPDTSAIIPYKDNHDETSQLKALITQNGIPQVSHVEPPEICNHDDVILKVRLAGVCRTDVLAAQGKIAVDNNRVLGHEFCGEISKLGSLSKRLKVGQRVAVNPVITCERCLHCRQNDFHLCGKTQLLGIHQDGAFAKYIRVSQKQIYAIDDSISDKLAAYAEPVAAMLSILHAEIPINSQIVINGSDRISQLCLLILQQHGYQNISLKTDTPCDVLIITSLINDELLLDQVNPGGLVIIKSRSPFQSQLNLADVVYKRLTIKGMNYSTFDQALHFIQKKATLLNQFLGESYALEAFLDAFEESQKKVFLRAD